MLVFALKNDKQCKVQHPQSNIDDMYSQSISLDRWLIKEVEVKQGSLGDRTVHCSLHAIFSQ